MNEVWSVTDEHARKTGMAGFVLFVPEDLVDKELRHVDLDGVHTRYGG